MKKIIALLLAAVMVFGLAACAAKTEAPKEEAPKAEEPAKEEAPKTEEPAKEEAPKAEEPAAEALPFEGVELSFWFPPYTGTDMEYWNARLEQFTAETGAKVTTTIVPWGDMSTKYMAGFMGGEGPDVFYTTNEILFDMIDAGICLELSPYFDADEVANQLYWSAGYMMGGQYAAPYSTGVSYRGFAYNLDLLEAAGVEGVPATFDEVIEAAQKVKEAGVCEYPIMFPVADDNASPLATFVPLLRSCGGDIVSEDATKATLDTPAALKAAQFLYDLSNTYEVLSKDAVATQYGALNDLFLEGKVAMCAGEAAAFVQFYEDQGRDFNWTMNISLNDGEHESCTFSPCDTMAVNADSANVDAAVALLKFLIRTDSREDFKAANYPTLAQLNADMAPDEFAWDFVARDMAVIGSHSKPLPVCKGISTITEAIKTNEQLLVMGELTPEEACQAMQDAAQAAIDG